VDACIRVVYVGHIWVREAGSHRVWSGEGGSKVCGSISHPSTLHVRCPSLAAPVDAQELRAVWADALTGRVCCWGVSVQPPPTPQPPIMSCAMNTVMGLKPLVAPTRASKRVSQKAAAPVRVAAGTPLYSSLSGLPLR
jgi:hypothetical protein